MPEHLVREYWNQTTLHPTGLTALIVLALAGLTLPRSLALLPLILMSCFVPAGQRIVVGTVDFPFLRLLAIVCVLRAMARSEYRGIRWMPLDSAMCLWGATAVVMYTLQAGEPRAFVSKGGIIGDWLAIYFSTRMWLRTWSDVVRVTVMFVFVSVPVMAAFLVEVSTQRNLFAIMGGVPEFTKVRDGRLRCQGAFSHPILAGCFWGAVLPLVAALWWQRFALKPLAVLGVVTMCIIIATTASSTPIMAVINAMVGAAFFVLRDHMRAVRWSLVGVLFGLHMVMKQPVWHLLARVDIVSGSTGWYRYVLIDGFIRNFDEWWLVGTPSTAHWRGEAWDITNQFVWEGVQGGLLTLALFIAVLSLAFRGAGRLRRACEAAGDKRGVVLSWALGTCLFVHTMNFFGVSYFGQIILVWNVCLAAVGSMEARYVAPSRQPSVAVDASQGWRSPGDPHAAR